MVLLHRVGVARHPALVVLLSALTFGLYVPFWYYATHKELAAQFELEEEQRDIGFGWLLYGAFLVRPLTLVYDWIFSGNIRFIEERFGLRALRPGSILAITTSAFLAGFTLLIVAIVVMQTPLLELPENATEEQEADALTDGLVNAIPYLALSYVVPFFIRMIAFVRIQLHINQIWTQFDARREEIAPTSAL